MNLTRNLGSLPLLIVRGVGRETEKRYGHAPRFSAVLARPRIYWRLVKAA